MPTTRSRAGRRQDVDFNIFEVYSEDSTNHTAFDPTSIMEYAIPDSLTIGSYAIGWNTEFSPADIEFMRRQYPRARPGTVELTVGGRRRSADLSASGEVDTYHFDVAARGDAHHDHRGADRHRADAARPERPPARCSPGMTIAAGGQRAHRAQAASRFVLAVGAPQESGRHRASTRSASRRPPAESAASALRARAGRPRRRYRWRWPESDESGPPHLRSPATSRSRRSR